MFKAKPLYEMISYVFYAHADMAIKPSKAVRKWDEATPYGVHPVWCAMTLLTETGLTEDIRETGAIALLYHDVLEDTRAGLPEGTLSRVKDLVEQMTFVSSANEMEEIWSREPVVKLLKLYDKTSNLLDGVWMSPEKRTHYADYLLRLCDEIERHWGQLNIIRIARAIA